MELSDLNERELKFMKMIYGDDIPFSKISKRVASDGASVFTYGEINIKKLAKKLLASYS